MLRADRGLPWGAQTAGGLMKSVSCVVAAAIAVAGCAKGPDSISATYVSPIGYQHYTCEQISAEATRLSHKAQELAGVQQKKATGDAVAMGVGLVLFWPALFLIKGNDEKAGELARVRGEMEAIQQASIQKNCGIQFEAPKPPAEEKVASTSKKKHRD
jgi:hypothetical protein